MSTRQETGARLRAWRDSCEPPRTQEWLAEATGIQQALISKYELGRVRPDPDNARKLDRATNGAIPWDSWYGPVSDDAPAGGELPPTSDGKAA